MAAPLHLLRRVPLFEALDDETLAALAARFQPRTYDRGAPVVDARSGGLGFFIIEEGEATVSVHGETRRKLGRGDSFGEVALIDGGRRSADIVADTHLHCHGISSQEFKPFVLEHPTVAWAMLEGMASRLREAETSAAADARARPRAAEGTSRWGWIGRGR